MTIINSKQRLVTPGRIKQKANNAVLIILKSINGETDWEMVLPQDVPAFVKRSDIVKRMIDGEMVQLETKDPHWFRAVQQVIH